MTKIIDNITGEITNVRDREEALQIARDTVKYHNSEFTYGRYGRHYSCNAIMTVSGNTIVIGYKH